MNISHAAAIVLYDLAGMEGGDFPLASGELLDLLYRNFESVLAGSQPSRSTSVTRHS